LDTSNLTLGRAVFGTPPAPASPHRRASGATEAPQTAPNRPSAAYGPTTTAPSQPFFQLPSAASDRETRQPHSSPPRQRQTRDTQDELEDQIRELPEHDPSQAAGAALPADGPSTPAQAGCSCHPTVSRVLRVQTHTSSLGRHLRRTLSVTTRSPQVSLSPDWDPCHTAVQPPNRPALDCSCV
jgi:hypothetical protein